MVKLVQKGTRINEIRQDIRKGEDIAVIDEKGRIIGIISNEKIIKYIFNDNLVVDKVIVRVKPLESEDPQELAQAILNTNLRVVLVKENDSLKVLDIFDVLKRVLDRDIQIFKNTIVDEVANKVETIFERDSIEKALGMMKFKGISRLVVVDSEGRAIGILSISDIIRNYSDLDRQKTLFDEKLDVEVRTLMSRNLIYVNTKTFLDEVVRIMIERRIFAVPVLENLKPIGIITAKDILAYYLAKKREKIYENIIVHGVRLDEIDYKFVRREIGKLLERYSKYLGEDVYVILHIKKVNEERRGLGRNIYFTIKGRLTSSKVRIFADAAVTDLYSGIRRIRDIFQEELERIKSNVMENRLISRLKKELDYL